MSLTEQAAANPAVALACLDLRTTVREGGKPDVLACLARLRQLAPDAPEDDVGLSMAALHAAADIMCG